MRRNEMDRNQSRTPSPSATWRPARETRAHRDGMDFGDEMDSGQRFDVSDRDYPRASGAGRASGNYDDQEYGRSTSNERSYNSDRGNEQENFRSLSNRNAADRGFGTQGMHGNWNRHFAGGQQERERGGMFGKGPKGWQRSDERIREEVCEALSNDHHIDASEIDVKVESGTVTLTGTVGDRETKRSAEACVEHLSGVDDVRNDLRVQRQGGMLSSLSGGNSEQSNVSIAKTAKLS